MLSVLNSDRIPPLMMGYVSLRDALVPRPSSYIGEREKIKLYERDVVSVLGIS